MEPLISVIVPVYKVEKYLDKCVRSLLAQTYPNYEIILVDDGSPDGCPALCDAYAEENGNVTALHKENGGLGDARNYGVKHAKGDWIVFVDSDDYVLPCYLSDLWELKEKHHADMAAALLMNIDEDGNILGPDICFGSFAVSGADALYEVTVKTHIGASACNKLYPKSVLARIPFPDGFHEDLACMYRIADSAGKVAIGDFNQNYKYVHYGVARGSIVHRPLCDKHIAAFHIYSEYDAYIDEKYPEMDYLKPVFLAQHLWEFCSRVIMSRQEYNQIFKMYRGTIRHNAVKVARCKRLPLKIKAKVLILCTEPWICRAFFAARKTGKMLFH